MSNWEPIESVPYGEEVLVFGGKRLMSGWPSGRRVVIIDEPDDIYDMSGKLRSTAPSHWCPLPAPPKEAAR